MIRIKMTGAKKIEICWDTGLEYKLIETFISVINVFNEVKQ